MRYIYISQFHDNCGYGSAARGYLKAFDKVNKDIQLNIYSISLETKNSVLSEEEHTLLKKYGLVNQENVDEIIKSGDYKVVWHMPPPMLVISEQYHTLDPHWANVRNLVLNSKDNINITVWEATDIPSSWTEIYKKYNTNHVIVPSQWNKEVFAKKVENVHLIPHVIHTPEGSDAQPLKLPVDFEDNFVVFSMSQWDNRKGFDALIKAFCMEFGNQEDAILIIKTYGIIASSYPVPQKEQAKQINAQVAAWKDSVFLGESGTDKPKCKIVVIPKVLPYENIAWLYEKSDLFALMTRGEGFGLTISEATTFGKPVLVPEQGGHLDYLETYQNKYLVKGHWSPYHSKPGYSCDMNWYEPDIIDARKRFREAYNDWSNNSITKNPNNLEDYSLEAVGKKFIRTLLETS